MFFSGPSAAALSSALTSSALVARSTSNTQSVSEALASGTRTAWPFSLPRSSGKISAIAVAEPVVVGIRLSPEARARRRSLCGVSRMLWVLVRSWMVVIEPWRMPSASWITLTTGARQLVVQEAAVTMRCCAGSNSCWLTPITTFSAPFSLTGAQTTTRFTPCSR